MIDTDKYERMLKDETYRLDGRNNMMALTLLAEVMRLRKGIKEVIHHLASKYDRDVKEQTDKLKEMIG